MLVGHRLTLGLVEDDVFEIVRATADGDGSRGASEHPVEDINLVGAEVGERSAAVFPEPAPVQEFKHVVVTLRENGIDLRLFIAGINRQGDAAVPLAVGMCDAAADLQLVHDFVSHELVTRIAPALVTDLQQLAGSTLAFHHLLGAFDCVGHHLFAIDLLASLVTEFGHGRVQPVGRSDEEGVDFLVLIEHFLHPQVGLKGTGRVFGANLLRGGLGLAFEDVAGGDPFDRDRSHLLDGSHQRFALGSTADEGNVDGIRRIGGIDGALGQREGGGSGGSPAQERAAGEINGGRG